MLQIILFLHQHQSRKTGKIIKSSNLFQRNKDMIPTHVWGNHHCVDENNFIATFQQLVRQQGRFYSPLIHASSQITLNAKVIRIIKKHLQVHRQVIEIHIFIFGDVELKKGQSPESILYRFEKLFELSQEFPLHQFVICSVIPEGINKDNQRVKACLLANSLIRRPIRRKEKITFVNVTKRLVPEDFEDPHHLNYQGGTKLAQSLAKAVYSIPKNKLT